MFIFHQYHAVHRLLLATLLFCALQGAAQDYSYVNYDVKDGLPASQVYRAVQDKEGFMWFATENGLSRFDGKHFKTFTISDGLPDNEIVEIFADSKGRVWIAPFKQEICYYYKGRIHNRQNDSMLKKVMLRNYCRGIVEDAEGDIFITQGYSSYFKVAMNGRVEEVNAVNGDPIQACQLLRLDNKSFLVFTKTANSFPQLADLLNLRTGGRQKVADKIVLDRNVLDLLDESRIVWAERDSLFVTGRPPLSLKALGLSAITRIKHLGGNKVVLTSNKGVAMLDVNTGQVLNRFLAGTPVNTCFLDREGGYWFCTRDKGVYRLSSLAFRNYSSQQYFGATGIYSFVFHQQNLFIGTGNGYIHQLGLQDFQWKRPMPIPEQFGRVVTSMMHLPGKLLVGTSMGLFKIRTDNNITETNENTNTIAVKDLATYKDSFLVASSTGPLVCDISLVANGAFYVGRVTTALYRQPYFHIGTLNGLVVVDAIRRDTVSVASTAPALAGRITKLAHGARNLVWVGTRKEGLLALDGKTVAHHITEKEGLTSNNCSALWVAGDTVWMGTEKGLNRIVVQNKKYQITRYTVYDGLASNIVNVVAVNGRDVFVGSPAGLTFFSPDSVSLLSQCILQMTGVYVKNRYWAYDTTDFKLSPKENDVRFEFSGISLKAAGEVMYQYRLLGLQDDWRTTTDNALSFPSLPAGDYRLQLRAVNKFGVESDMKEVVFSVGKRWWQRAWVWLLGVLLLALGIRFYLRYRVRQLRAKETVRREMEQRINELEQKALRSQMNPHFIFNSLNSIQQYVAERDIEGANRFISDFSKLIRLTLDLSSQNRISLRQEIDYLDTYLRVERTRLENEFDYQVQVDAGVDVEETQLPPLLLQPYVENSIRHGIKYLPTGTGCILLTVAPHAKGVLVAIEDNGIGREASKAFKSHRHVQYQSKGMSISANRAALQSADEGGPITIQIIDLTNQNGQANGTRVEVLLPQPGLTTS
jgi:ligand-binding sensor domain-containing protein/signal transduction histidine kinase